MKEYLIAKTIAEPTLQYSLPLSCHIFNASEIPNFHIFTNFSLIFPIFGENTEITNQKLGRNIILYRIDLKAGILVKKTSDGSALPMSYNMISCVASISYFYNCFLLYFHIPRIIEMSKSLIRNIKKSFKRVGS